MRYFRCYKWLILFLFFFMGCMPYHFTEKPGVLGRAIDAETKAPIKDVMVQLKYASVQEYIDVNCLTDDSLSISKTLVEGNFHIIPQKKWGIYIVPTDVFPLSYKLVFTHENYAVYSVDFPHGATDKLDTVNIGTIRLKQK